jgi:DNA-binding transcriptional MerR regulator
MKFDTERFTAAQVVKITRVPYGTLNYWAKVGLVKPSVATANGSGSRRIYDFQDLAAIRVALKLRRAGIFGRALARILAVIRQEGFDSMASVAIDVTPAGDAVVTPQAGESFSARRSPGQLYLDLRCDFSEATAALRKQINKERNEGPRKPIRGARRAVHPRAERKKA